MTLEKANHKHDVWVCPKMRYTLQFTGCVLGKHIINHGMLVVFGIFRQTQLVLV